MSDPGKSGAPMGRLRLMVATGCGLGYAPIASGTFGSLPGLLLYVALYNLGGSLAVLIALPLVVIVGIWAANAAETHFNRKDPGHVVIDEIAGQLVALVFMAPTPGRLLAAFLLFRLFDIIKPFPARRLESLPGGTGIMLDDLVAGAYANLALLALVRLFPDLAGL